MGKQDDPVLLLLVVSTLAATSLTNRRWVLETITRSPLSADLVLQLKLPTEYNNFAVQKHLVEPLAFDMNLSDRYSVNDVYTSLAGPCALCFALVYLPCTVHTLVDRVLLGWMQNSEYHITFTVYWHCSFQLLSVRRAFFFLPVTHSKDADCLFVMEVRHNGFSCLNIYWPTR